MATKLNKGVKEELIKKVVKDTFAERRHALKESEYKVAEAIYNALYPPCEESPIERILTPRQFIDIAPLGMLPSRTQLGIAIKGEQWNTCLYFLSCERRVALQDLHSNCFSVTRLGEAAHAALSEMHFEHRKKVTTLEKEESALSSKLNVFLAPIPTYERLFAEWPEASKYISIPEKSKNLPTVLVDEIRATIDRSKGSL